jgi:MoxR-like ATPase
MAIPASKSTRSETDPQLPQLQKAVLDFRAAFEAKVNELSKVIVGQHDIIQGVLVALYAGGHVLLEGVPGLGKTILVRTLSQITHLSFSRVQFTPDLMPADVVGTNLIVERDHGRKEFEFQPGPIFANILLADEINRATPKTQSALLEAMQERQVTVSGVFYQIVEPFLVLATQNPLEMEGTYPLPEAQLDRFLFKLKVEYPTAEDLHTILDRTTQATDPEVSRVATAEQINAGKHVIREVPVTREIQSHAIRIVLATHPGRPESAPLATKYVRYGASPRGAQALILAAKIYALLDGRFHVSRADIDRAALPALRHRVVLNFEGEAEGRTSEEVISEALKLAAR